MTEDEALAWLNLSRSVPLNLPEFTLVAEHYQLPEPNLLSPLPELYAAEVEGEPRAIEAIVEPTSGAEGEAISLALTPLAVPDRVIDVRLALFNSSPELTRLYASRLVENQTVALAPHTEFDYELIFPFSYDDLMVWLRMQLQFSSSMTFPLHQMQFSAHELAFLLALADAYKSATVRSFLPRRQGPVDIVITARAIAQAERDALEIPDRRWLRYAVDEFFAEIIHIGGEAGVRLPGLTERQIESEIARYIENGFLVQAEGEEEGYLLGEPVGSFIGDLFNWISLISLHDLQIVGGTADRPEAQEEALVFITTGSTVWMLATEGLTDCKDDLNGVRFGMRSLAMVTALDVAADFIAPATDVEIAEDYYGTAPMRAFEGTMIEEMGSKTCPACGASVREGVKFCTQCGQALDASGS